MSQPHLAVARNLFYCVPVSDGLFTRSRAFEHYVSFWLPQFSVSVGITLANKQECFRALNAALKHRRCKVPQACDLYVLKKSSLLYWFEYILSIPLQFYVRLDIASPPQTT